MNKSKERVVVSGRHLYEVTVRYTVRASQSLPYRAHETLLITTVEESTKKAIDRADAFMRRRTGKYKDPIVESAEWIGVIDA